VSARAVFLRVLAAAAAVVAYGCSSHAGPELNVYAAQGQEVTTPLIDAWQKKNPSLRINVIRGGAGELLSRVRAERANPLGDVFWGGALELYRANDDLFAPADLAEAAAFDAHDPLKKWHPWTRNVIHLAVNTRRVPDDPPRSLRDLADPKWAARGRIGLSNPASSGTAYTIVPALVTAHGWDFMDAFLRNVRMTDYSETSFKWLKDGEVAVGFLFESILKDYISAGAPLKMIVPEEGIIQQADGCGLLAGAKHPEAAVAFLNWMAGEEAHAIVRSAVGRRSARKGVAPPDGLIDLTGLRAIEPDAEWVTKQRDDILRRFAEARARAQS
jgi:iron(III) transport system substrate-binding protein